MCIRDRFYPNGWRISGQTHSVHGTPRLTRGFLYTKKLHRVRCSYPILLFFQFRQPIHRLRIDLCQADHVVHRNPFIFLVAQFDLVRETRSKSNRIRDRSGICLLYTSQKLDIPRILRYFNDWNIYEQNPSTKLEYTTWIPAGRHASDCIGCKACEEKCPPHLPISQAMKEAAEAMGV